MSFETEPDKRGQGPQGCQFGSGRRAGQVAVTTPICVRYPNRGANTQRFRAKAQFFVGSG